MSQSVVRPVSPSALSISLSSGIVGVGAGGGDQKDDIHFVGDIFCDLLAKNVADLPQWGGDASASIQIMPGGSCLNSICHCAEYSRIMGLSTKTAIFSSIADDHQGAVCKQRLKDVGVSIDNLCIRKKEERSTGTCIVVSGPTDRLFVTDSGCNGALSTTLFREEELFRCGHMHISGFYNVTPLKLQTKELFAAAHKREITTSLNCQFDVSNEWGLIAEICPYLDFMVGNTIEVNGIVGREGGAADDEDDWVRCLLFDKGLRVLIVTKARDGVNLFMRCDSEALDGDDGGGSPSIEPGRIVNSKYHHSYLKMELSGYNVDPQFKDCTGAGDAFVGGFLGKWISLGKMYSRKVLYKALQAGCMCGATAVTQYGGCFSDTDIMKEIYGRIYPDVRIEIEIQENRQRSASLDVQVVEGGGGGVGERVDERNI